MPIMLLQLALELHPPLFVVYSLISVSSHDSKKTLCIILKSEYRIVVYIRNKFKEHPSCSS